MMAEIVTIAELPIPPQMLVIADDFTGANDTGVALVGRGLKVCVQFDVAENKPIAGQAQIYSTDSRALMPIQAALRVTKVIQSTLAGLSDSSWVFKKMDSTLRGNPGAETEAALNALDCRLAIVATAVPELGRIVTGGYCYVNGCLLTDTEFATDPKTPVNTASVGECFAEQTTLRQHHISLDALRSADFSQRLAALANSGVRMVIVDSHTSADLALIVKAAESLPFRPLLVGASGLSHALAEHCLSVREISATVVGSETAPALAVIGSMSETAASQIAFACQHRPTTVIDIDILELFSPDAQRLLPTLCAQICRAMGQGKHCIVSTCQNGQQRQEVAMFCQQKKISRSQMGERIAAFLGQLTQQVFEDSPVMPGGLFLSGGDIALAVARALGATGFEIKGQIAGCVPWGYLLDSQFQRLPVMTKAGGFGAENTLFDVLRFIEEKLSD
ncbi:four-carbon acid sugar kinase family protein [Rouxiella sp. WC2420]|uniref:Four-carbon acid sugar kinase family protein n=1 Tax=Rouxiella sp. WC2420 TaxID=3234145 RepID=A0AB39VJT5_9GAMM